MDLKAFYEKVGGNYDEVMGRLMKEERALKYLSRMADDPNYSELLANLDAQNYPDAFRSVHTLKGLALNLGLGKLAEASSTLCEDLRNGPPAGDVAKERADVEAAYKESVEAIQELINA